jgi:hypothetical protein
MKKLSLIGFSMSVIFLIFGLYLILIIAPESETAALEMEMMQQANMGDYSVSLFETPGYAEAFATSEKKVDYGMVLLLGSFLPFLLCIIPVFKKNKLAILGLVFSLGAFFIGAAYGSHMFS